MAVSAHRYAPLAPKCTEEPTVPPPPTTSRCRRRHGCWWSIIGFVLLLVIVAPLPTFAQTRAIDLAASYRFLISDRTAGGILYTATAGNLQGQQLPLSFYDSAAYWGEHVCSTADCTVIDTYNPQTYTLTPRTSVGGDLQTERVNSHDGANIYDAATWQIAVMLGKVVNKLPLGPGQDAYGLASNQNLLLREGYSGNSSHPITGETRAATAGPVFVYNQHVITDPAQAYSFRMLPRSWLSTDPFVTTPYARFIKTADLPPHNAAYQPGKMSWTDWKPITGENAWAFLIGPLQAADIQYRLNKKAAHVPFQESAVQNALAILPTFAAMQSPLGAVYYAPAGTVANQGDQLVDPYFIAVENNISLYAGLKILRTTLEHILSRDKDLSSADRATITNALQLSGAMINGGTIGANRKTAGLLAFFKNFAWHDGEFIQGGIADKPAAASNWLPTLAPKAVDVNTWGIAALGPETIDGWFGFGASYRNWQQVKRWGGYGAGSVLWGVGFSDQDGNGSDANGTFRQGIASVEWTAGAITMIRTMIAHYQTISPPSPHVEEAGRFTEDLRRDERSMLAAMDKLRVDTYADSDFNGKLKHYDQLFKLSTKPYLYASKRYFIPFGWYANPIPSTCATAWMLMAANNYNPFVPGGGLP